ncbi:hypothetical protein AVEN_178377-1 [Araneus ventricosus]|uniref:Uncharacterized protein n=1 Tax=Araneus ventricosus TaxID=182803 RepID=A0A4Y2BF09_ARAVE|nr:hypothetical protein AVEN_178377-1 [Araneus ventricosus]
MISQAKLGMPMSNIIIKYIIIGGVMPCTPKLSSARQTLIPEGRNEKNNNVVLLLFPENERLDSSLAVRKLLEMYITLPEVGIKIVSNSVFSFTEVREELWKAMSEVEILT